MTARRRLEIPAYGVDEFKQLNGSDPWGSNSWLGLRVPTLATNTLAAANGVRPWQNRYLFMGPKFSVAERSRARLLGFRQFLEIGVLLTGGEGGGASGPRPLLLPVTTPDWSFSDATVSWHFRRLGPPGSHPIGLPTPAPNNLKCLAFRESDTPALLYESVTLPAADTFYTDLTAYTPPNAGRPWGTPLTDNPSMSTIYGLQTDYRHPDAWQSLDVEVRGPETVACLISVAQTNPATRPEILGGFTPASFGIGISPEDAFVQTVQNVFGLAGPIYWRVGASLIVEVDSLVSEVRAMLGGEGAAG